MLLSVSSLPPFYTARTTTSLFNVSFRFQALHFE